MVSEERLSKKNRHTIFLRTMLQARRCTKSLMVNFPSYHTRGDVTPRMHTHVKRTWNSMTAYILFSVLLLGLIGFVVCVVARSEGAPTLTGVDFPVYFRISREPHQRFNNVVAQLYPRVEVAYIASACLLLHCVHMVGACRLSFSRWGLDHAYAHHLLFFVP